MSILHEFFTGPTHCGFEPSFKYPYFWPYPDEPDSPGSDQGSRLSIDFEGHRRPPGTIHSWPSGSHRSRYWMAQKGAQEQFDE